MTGIATPAEPALRAVDLVKTYGHGDTAVHALDSVSVDIDAGRFTAVMGPSGSGKTTLMQCLAGLDTVTSGRVLLGGIELTGLSDRALTTVRRDRIGYIFQAFNLLPQLTAAKNIMLPLDLSGRRADPARFDHLISVLGLGGRLEHLPAELSGGQQQRVAIARALLAQPQVVFADEPTGNLDSRSGAEVMGLLRSLVSDLGQTVVLVTHDPRAARYTDRVILLTDGRIVADLDEPTEAGIAAALTTGSVA